MGPSPRKGQERSAPHEGQLEKGSVPPPEQNLTQQELRAKARVWQEHLRRQQGRRSRSGRGRRASLPTPVETTVAENCSLISNSADHIAAHHRSDLDAVEQAAALAEELERRRETEAALVQAAADSAEAASSSASAPRLLGDPRAYWRSPATHNRRRHRPARPPTDPETRSRLAASEGTHSLFVDR